MKEMIISSLVDVEFWATTVLGQWLCTSVGSSKTHTPFSICYFEVASGSILFYISTTVSLFPSFNRSLLVLCVCVCVCAEPVEKLWWLNLFLPPSPPTFLVRTVPFVLCPYCWSNQPSCFSLRPPPYVCTVITLRYTTRQFNNARTRHKCTGTLFLWYFYWV
jgi:hypothetical protein